MGHFSDQTIKSIHQKITRRLTDLDQGMGRYIFFKWMYIMWREKIKTITVWLQLHHSKTEDKSVCHCWCYNTRRCLRDNRATRYKCPLTPSYCFLTFNWAEVIPSSITCVCIFTQALQQSLLLDLLHIQSIGFKFTSLPLAQPAHSLHRQILTEQTDKRPVFTFHLRANVPPDERHSGQRADTEGSGQGGWHRCGEEPVLDKKHKRKLSQVGAL